MKTYETKRPKPQAEIKPSCEECGKGFEPESGDQTVCFHCINDAENHQEPQPRVCTICQEPLHGDPQPVDLCDEHAEAVEMTAKAERMMTRKQKVESAARYAMLPDQFFRKEA